MKCGHHSPLWRHRKGKSSVVTSSKGKKRHSNVKRFFEDYPQSRKMTFEKIGAKEYMTLFLSNSSRGIHKVSLVSHLKWKHQFFVSSIFWLFFEEQIFFFSFFNHFLVAFRDRWDRGCSDFDCRFRFPSFQFRPDQEMTLNRS